MGRTIHGCRKTAEYRAWDAMKQRCMNKKCVNYKKYGAKGITIHPEWVHDFQAFINHIGPRPSPEHSLDRYPNNQGNYEPGNVRWATIIEQNQNTKAVVWVTHQGKTRCLADWARVFGVSAPAIQYHYKRYGDLSHFGLKRGARL